MKSQFLKYYNSLIISEADQQTTGKKTIQQVMNDEQFKSEVFQQVAEQYSELQMSDVNTAAQEVYEAYKKNDSLFDKIKKVEKKTNQNDSQSDSQTDPYNDSQDDSQDQSQDKNTSSDTSTSSSKTKETEKSDDVKKKKLQAIDKIYGGHTTQKDIEELKKNPPKGKVKKYSGNVTLKTNANGQVQVVHGKQINQSITIQTSQFKSYYNEIFDISNPSQIIKEAEQEDVQDGNYMLVVTDDGNFHVVNTQDEDEDTKFTVEDYKKIDKWVNENKDIWLKYVKQYGGSSLIFSDELISEILENSNIQHKDQVKDIIIKIKGVTQFKQFTAYFKNIKKEKGQISKQQQEDLQKRYLYAVCLFIDKGIDNAPTPAERAEQKKKKAQEAGAINAIDISRSKNPELYNHWVKAFTKYCNDTHLNDALCQGTGDADDQQIQWSENAENDAWQNCQPSDGLPNELVPLLTNSYQNDNLQIKFTALFYVIQTVEAKQKAEQYSGDDYKQKMDALNNVRQRAEKFLTSKKVTSKVIKIKSSFNFNFQNKDTLKQIIQQSK